jgi:hypothetical protein
MHDKRLMDAPTFRPATETDARYIGANLRACDLLEAQMLSSMPMPDLLEQSRAASVWSRVADVDGSPAMIFGITPSSREGWGVPWLLATDKFSAINKRLVRRCHIQVREMHTHYPNLHNIVHRSNATSINWLRWLGFSIGTVPCGPSGEFFMFWRKENV